VATDWTKLRVEYVTSSVTLRDLAAKHGVKPAGVMRRAAKEGWEAERKQESAKVSKVVLETSATDRAAELEKFNADDLKMARAIRAKAASMMGSASTPQDLSALARAVETAQKVGRLSLGATTDNTGISAPGGGPVGLDHFYGDVEEGDA
jgi:hypothetical protein